MKPYSLDLRERVAGVVNAGRVASASSPTVIASVSRFSSVCYADADTPAPWNPRPTAVAIRPPGTHCGCAMTCAGLEVRRVPWASVPSTEKTW